jgi:hypothetical protein
MNYKEFDLKIIFKYKYTTFLVTFLLALITAVAINNTKISSKVAQWKTEQNLK